MKSRILCLRGLLVLIFFCLSTMFGWAQSAAIIDSLMNRLRAVEGQEKLELYSSICTHAASQNSVKDEIRLLNEYKVEAARQGNKDHEAQARTLRLYAFYNNNLPDSLKSSLLGDLSFFEKCEKWELYYSCRSLGIERMQYENKLQSALRESQQMYEYANRQRSDYGKGVSAYQIASCYQSMSRNKEAADFFLQAEQLLLKDKNVGQLHNLYAMAWQALATVGMNEELLRMIDRWEVMWKEYCEKNHKDLSSVKAYYLVCILARAHVYIQEKKLSEAHQILQQAEIFAQGQRDVARALLLKEQGLYYEAVGDYQRSLQYFDERYRIQKQMNNQLSAIETQEKRARVLLKMGEYEQAARVYSEVLPRKDSLFHAELTIQLDELSTIYKVDTLKMEKAQLRLWMIIGIISTGVFILLLLGYIYYNYRLRGKNRAIYQQYRKQKQAEEMVDRLLEKVPAGGGVDRDMELFLQIKKLLSDPEILSESSLERTFLAEKLNTNYTYIARAIQIGADMTVKKYITQIRIDYACKLLQQNRECSIIEIQEKCGFQSSSSFNRIFKEYMRMTPSDFRKGSQD